MSKVFAALVAALAVLVQGAAVAAAERADRPGARSASYVGVVKRIDRGSKTVVVTVKERRASGKRAARGKSSRDIKFDVAAARIRGRDANGDGSIDLADLSRGQSVQVVVNRSRRLRKSRRGLLRASKVTAKASRRDRSQPAEPEAGDPEEQLGDGPGEDDEDEEPAIDFDGILGGNAGAARPVDTSSDSVDAPVEDAGLDEGGGDS